MEENKETSQHVYEDEYVILTQNNELSFLWILSSHLEQLLQYFRGVLDREHPFEILKQLGNLAERKIHPLEIFSIWIRKHLLKNIWTWTCSGLPRQEVWMTEKAP